MNKRIFLSPPHMSGRERHFVKQAFDTNWVAPLGPNVDGFEKDLCDFTGAKACAALSAGTAAIHLSLILLGVKQGDEVICSSFTFSASCNPIVYQGATPILIDSEIETWNMSPELLEKAIKDRISKGKKPKAIVFVHLYGMPSKIDEILEISNKYEIPLIEDAAEALGSEYKGKKLGTFGKFGILSFNGNKIITTSGGGALISDDVEMIAKARFLATQARDNAPHYQHTNIGYNYRMSNIVAGVGRGQMEALKDRVRVKREIFKFYKSKLQNITGISFLEEPNKDFYSNHWLTCILVDSKKTGFSREDLRLKLEEANIESRPLWKPMHLQPIFADCPAYIDGTSEKLFNDGLCLPSGTAMNKEDFERVLDVFKTLVYRNFKKIIF